MTQKSYYVGVLLAASQNPLNKIQFVARKEKSGKFSLFSRVSKFSSPVNTHRMKFHGEFSSLKDACLAIWSGKTEMRRRGITVPGVEVLLAE